jgi:hypothetical protein
MVSESPAQLDEQISEMTRAWAEAPLPVVQLEVERGSSGLVVKGTVLTFGQVRQVRRAAEAHGAAVDVAVVADPDLGLEQAWLEIDGPGALEIWRDPVDIGLDHARQTEYLPADGPLRLLGQTGTARLVQGPDLTLGWIKEAGVTEVDAEAARRKWNGYLRSKEGRSVPPDPTLQTFGGNSIETLEALVDAARAQLGAPYRWGGTTPAGFDCSGLIQRVFSTAAGVILPKHTGDQRHAGVRVPAGKAHAGDLLFATPRTQRVGHVMLVTAPDTVLHACRTELRVIEESLEANALRYQHQGYRRPVQLLPGEVG